MAKKKYVVDLSAEERTTLEQLLQKGKSSARKLTRARILLHADEGETDEEIATALAVGVATVERTRQRFVEANLEALNERPRPGGPCKLSGKQEAHLIAVACTPAPSGPNNGMNRRPTKARLAVSVTASSRASHCSGLKGRSSRARNVSIIASLLAGCLR